MSTDVIHDHVPGQLEIPPQPISACPPSTPLVQARELLAQAEAQFNDYDSRFQRAKLVDADARSIWNRAKAEVKRRANLLDQAIKDRDAAWKLREESKKTIEQVKVAIAEMELDV